MDNERKIIVFDSFTKTIDVAADEVCKIYLINIIPIDKANDYIQYKTNLTVNLGQKNGKVEIYQIGIANHVCGIDSNITINHIASDCESKLISHYILKDALSLTSWVGNVKINYDAVRTKTFEENRNLILETGAKAISEPNLEIFEGDIIEAKHSSSSTKPDDEELFYIMSRGINKTDAKQLLIDAFLNNIISKMDLTKSEREEIDKRIKH